MTVQVFRITRRWRFRFSYHRRVTLMDGRGTLGPSFWLHVGPYEVRIAP